MKIIFFSPAENIERLLRVNMNIACKGSIVHFFETYSKLLSQVLFRVYASSKVHLSRLSTLDSLASILASRNLNVSNFTTRELSFEDRVETVNLPLSSTVLSSFSTPLYETYSSLSSVNLSDNLATLFVGFSLFNFPPSAHGLSPSPSPIKPLTPGS